MRVAAAYDSIASSYDSQLAPAQWVRSLLWERLDSLFPPGSTVLDVTAGTGLDAIHLTERGVQVVAGDISPKMLARLRAKSAGIETRVLDFNALDFGVWSLKFDGVISTFAGLNTSPDLRPFAQSAARLLRPGGVLFVHLLNRWPLLDLIRWRSRGWRRWTREVNIGGVSVTHYLYSPLSLYRQVFAPHFRLSQFRGYGIVRPIEMEGGNRLATLERRLNRLYPFHSLGVFFSLELCLDSPSTPPSSSA